jgi:hypothetical protein
MFKQIVLAAVFVGALGATTVATPDTAEARRYWGRPYATYYYGAPRAYYRWNRPYRAYYYGAPYRPYYGRYYYGYPGYYYYSPRSGVTFSFGF